MKAINKISQILAIVFSAAALVLFFMPFVEITATSGNVSLIGSELAFGGKEFEGLGVLCKSSKILFCFILTAFTLLFSALTFKFKKLRYWAPGVGLVAAIFMLVIALSEPGLFVDYRPLILAAGTRPEYTVFVLLTVIALFCAAVFGVCHLLVDDYLMTLEDKEKKTIFKRVVLFFRDYKSEVKKIVWPGVRDVVKNTLIVLIVCLLIGGFIWLLDFGLGSLMSFISKM